jgi:hypothetical protein
MSLCAGLNPGHKHLIQLGGKGKISRLLYENTVLGRYKPVAHPYCCGLIYFIVIFYKQSHNLFLSILFAASNFDLDAHSSLVAAKYSFPFIIPLITNLFIDF